MPFLKMVILMAITEDVLNSKSKPKVKMKNYRSCTSNHEINEGTQILVTGFIRSLAW